MVPVRPQGPPAVRASHLRLMAIGERLTVADAGTRVRGTVRYALNAERVGGLVGVVVRSPHPHAILTSVDVTRAAQVPNVVAIVTRDDLGPGSGVSPYFGPLVRDQPIVALDRVRYVGEPIVGIAAEDADAAAEAAALVSATYEPLDPLFTALDARREGAPSIHENAPERNCVASYVIVHGDAEAALRNLPIVVSGEYTTPLVQHVALEPHVVLAEITADGRILVETTNQTPHHLRRQLAQIFGVPLTRVRVTVPMLGGAFGAKCYPEVEPIAVMLARKARRPVKITLSRAEEFVTTGRQAARVRITTGTDGQGYLRALRAELLFSNGAYAETGDRVVRNAARALTSSYRIPALHIEGLAYYTNTVPCGPFRAPGAAQAAWAMESHIDEVAHRAGIDPLAFRLRNVVASGESYADGGLLESIQYPEMLTVAARAVGWQDPPRDSHASPRERIGRGLSMVMKTTNTPSASTSTVKLNQDGSLDVLSSSVEMGQGATTVLAQIAAARSGVPVERVRISLPDTDATPFDQSTTSSRTTFAMGEAITRAVHEVATTLRALAADALEVSPGDVALQDGRASVAGALGRSIDYGALVQRSGRGNLQGKGTFISSAKPDPLTGAPGASAHYHQAVGAAEVAVDTETGRVRVLRLHAGVFAGVAINPTLCELQVEGSALFGLGQALSEEIHLDHGQVTNANLGDYLIPGPRDVPAFLEAALHEEHGHDEVHGIGEVAAPVATPAIANAVFQAVGVRIRELPITPERVLRALREQRGEGAPGA